MGLLELNGAGEEYLDGFVDEDRRRGGIEWDCGLERLLVR